ncbi:MULTISPECIES: hypothetical protein [Trichocoleus]|uniref:Uncharacterized protein n=1 Tax=Trichocoleus desertorum GB2-A4 TaxID=2933944 RepID=A0ABV0JFB2_9CYAN|nr:hypothetical protein [Trichocoleus sp. FACHB-46]MBD1862336.1 hypothetical protein [Trichocoleus sp. FACHB-46]
MNQRSNSSDKHSISAGIGNRFVYHNGGNLTYTDSFENSFHQKYWMYLVVHELYEGLTSVDSFVTLIANFGKALGDKAEVVLPLKSAYKETRRSVTKKIWQPETAEDLAKTQDIYMLVISKCLSLFDPEKGDKFLLLRFPGAESNPFQYIEILKSLEEEIHQNNNIFAWYCRRLNSQAKNDVAERIVSSVEAKPGIFGFSIDLKQLILGSK